MTDSNEPIRILASPAAAQRISRRVFLAGASGAAVGGSMLLSACGESETDGDGGTGGSSPGPVEAELSMYTWGEYDDPKVFKSFTADIGPEMIIDSYSSNEEMIAKLVATKGTSGYDIVVPTGVFIPQMVQNDLLEELDTSRLTNFGSLEAQYLDQPWDPGNAHSVPKAWGTTGYVYDRSKIDREMSTWQDFIDVATTIASGQTSILDSPDNLVGIYFWANDMSWTTTDEAELDACEEFCVNTLASHIKAFESYPGGGGIQQGTYWLAHAWNGDARQGILGSKNEDLVWVLPGPRTEIWMDNWCIPTGAPHPNAAYAWIDYVLDPAISLKELAFHGYHTAVTGIEPAAEEAGLERLDMVFFTEEQVATMEAGEVNEAQQRRVDIWNKTKAAAV